MNTNVMRALGRSACALLGMICGQFTVVVMRAADAPDNIDWNRARELLQKSRQSGNLTADERAFLERAQAAREKDASGGNRRGALANIPPEDRERAREIMEKQRNQQALTEDERNFIRKVRATVADQKGEAPRNATTDNAAREKSGITPLTDMTGDQRYKGRDGSLYGGGKNEPPSAHAKAAEAEAQKLKPLDAAGKPSAGGRIALLSVGMSNTTQEYSRFKELADRDPEKASSVVIVDGAQGGQAAAQWVTAPDNRVWQTVDSRLKAAGVTDLQVQAAWLKQANIRPTQAFPAHAEELAADLTKLLHLLKLKFPNLRIVYLSSRIYGGYATTPLNPEPYAFEGAFAVRDLITRQISGDADLNYDSAKGAVKSPLLLWGPYLWADGLTPRQSDGLIWKREDFRDDGTHPSDSGRDKVAKMLLAFLKTNAAARPWFLAKPSEPAKR
jgi:hypothetical protein